MRENVIIAYRGTNYELGQWPQGYGIWTSGASHSQPNEWWPGTPEGWSAAWYRFVAIEVPGTIVQVSPPAAVPAGPPAAQTTQTSSPTGPPDLAQQAGPPSLQPFILPAGQPHIAAGSQPYTAQAGQAYAGQPHTGQPHTGQAYTGQPYPGQGYAVHGHGGPPWGQPNAAAQDQYPSQRLAASAAWRYPVAIGLLIFGLVCGVIGLFPTYTGGSSLASDAVDLVPHVIYLVAWAAAALLIGMGGTRQRTGALLGLGVSVVTFGLFFADAGLPLAHGAHSAGMGAGLVLGLVGWLGCAAGSILAFGPWPADWPRPARGRELAFAATMIAAAVGAAITFAPSWDRYVLSTPTATQTLTEGNAFSNPGPVIVGNVAVMIAVVAVLVVASLWRPARIGWALAAGAIIPLIAQLISAIVQIAQSPLTQLGITKAEANGAHLSVTASLTGWFWAYCAFVIVLVLMSGWLAARPVSTTAVAAPAGAAHTGPATGWPATAAPGTVTPAGPGTTTAAPGMTGAAEAETATAPSPHSQSPAEGQAADDGPAADATPNYPGQPQGGTAEPGPA